jgi:predicted DNA-binding transcriptional regulator YafY
MAALMPKKWDDATPGMKLLSLYMLLLFSDGRKWSLTNLSKRLNCSKRVVLRLVEQMELTANCDVVKTKENRQVYFHIERRGGVPDLDLDPVSLDNLVMCRDFVWHLLPADVRAGLEATLNRMAALVPDLGTDREGHGRSIAVRKLKGHVDYSTLKDQFAALTKAIRLKRVCEIDYKRSLVESDRRLKFAPFELVVLQETVYVTGWILERSWGDGPSTLALHRIAKVEMTDRGYLDLHPPVPVDANFGLMRGESLKAVIRFDPEAALYVAERIWSGDQSVKVLKDGGVELTMTANNEVELKSWILGFGRQATLLEPEWLREELAAEIKDLSGRYQGGRGD